MGHSGYRPCNVNEPCLSDFQIGLRNGRGREFPTLWAGGTGRRWMERMAKDTATKKGSRIMELGIVMITIRRCSVQVRETYELFYVLNDVAFGWTVTRPMRAGRGRIPRFRFGHPCWELQTEMQWTWSRNKSNGSDQRCRPGRRRFLCSEINPVLLEHLTPICVRRLRWNAMASLGTAWWRCPRRFTPVAIKVVLQLRKGKETRKSNNYSYACEGTWHPAGPPGPDFAQGCKLQISAGIDDKVLYGLARVAVPGPRS